VFTADALHVHRDNLTQIVERGGDYLITVKGKQPGLRAGLAALFPPDPAGRGDFPPSPHHL
jgi:hypothetical protein